MPKEINKKAVHLKKLAKATIVARNSLLLLIVLTVIKGFGGYITNIVAVIGDAVGSFGDIIAASAIYVGLIISQKKASKTFKYGYHRVETLISLVISIVIIAAGVGILFESLNRLEHPAQTGSHLLGMVTSVISIFASLFAFYYQRESANEINSTALHASAYDKRNDAFVSGGVFFGIIADKFGIPYVEGAMGMILSLPIMWNGLTHAKDSLFYLLDYWNEPKITEQIKSILGKSRIVTSVKNVRLRHAGTYIFGEAFLEVNPFTDSKDLRDEIHRLDSEVEKNVEHLGDLVLYIDPPKPAVVRVALPIVADNGLNSIIAEDRNTPFHFLFIEIKNGKIQNYYTRLEKFSINDVAKITAFLKEQRVNILISNLIRPLLYYLLRFNNIKVYPRFLDVPDAANTVKLLLLDI